MVQDLTKSQQSTKFSVDSALWHPLSVERRETWLSENLKQQSITFMPKNAGRKTGYIYSRDA